MDDNDNETGLSGDSPGAEGIDSDLAGPSGPPPGPPSKGCPHCGSTRRHKKDCPNAGTGARSNSSPARAANVSRKTDDEWIADVATAWLGLWFIIKLIVTRLGWREKEPLTNEEARADARVISPIVRNYVTLIRIMNWLAAPIVLIKRFSEKFERKPRQPKGDHAESIRPGLVAGRP